MKPASQQASKPARFSMSGNDLLQRRIDEKCIRCGTRVHAATSDGVKVIDLPPLYCKECEAAMDAERLRQNRLKPNAKKVRNEGIANLDRLLGKET